MFKTAKLVLNNLNEKSYIKNRENLKLYDTTKNNLVVLSSDSKKMTEIDTLETNLRHNNLQIFLKNWLILRGKQLTVYVAPVILGALTISSLVHGKYVKTESINAYKNSYIEFDEENLYEDSYYIFAKTDIPRKYLDENVIGDNGLTWKFDTNSRVSNLIVYYGEGDKSIQVNFGLTDNGTWQYVQHTKDLFKKTNEVNQDTKEIDQSYKDLIHEATEVFISQAVLTDEEIEYLRELVANNENDILIKMRTCTDFHDMDLETAHIHWLRIAILLITDILLGCLIVKKDFLKVRDIKVYDSNQLYENPKHIGLRYAALKYREQFAIAEQNRLSSIYEILNKNNGSDSILTKYEKKLLKDK